MATVEHAALVVLVALALAAGGGVADAAWLPRAVAAQLHKAYCLVANGDCLGPGGPRPCVVGSARRTTAHAATLLVFRLRDGRSVQLERRADGSVRVAVTAWEGGGAGARFGGRVRIGRWSADGGADVAAGADVLVERRFVAGDLAAAQRLVERLDDEDPAIGAGAVAVAEFVRGGGDEDDATIATRGRVEAAAALEAAGLGATGELAAAMTAGLRLDRRTGEPTIVLRMDRALAAQLDPALVGAGFGADAQVGAEIGFDRAGRATTLTVHGAGAARADGRIAGIDAGRGARVEAEARLDVSDPVLRTLAERLLRGDLGAARRLAEQAVTRARVDVRVLETTHDEDANGFAAEAIAGLGAERVTSVDTARLTGAAGRDPGQPWGPRLDCGRVA